MLLDLFAEGVREVFNTKKVLELKDAGPISDATWEKIRGTFQDLFPSIHFVRKQREALKQKLWRLEPKHTFSGITLNPQLLLEEVIVASYSPLQVKQVIDTFGTLDAARVLAYPGAPSLTALGFKVGRTISSVKCCWSVALWEGKDCRALIEKNGEQYLSFVNKLLEDGGRFIAQGTEIQIRFWFVADFAALRALFGSHDCFHCDWTMKGDKILLHAKGANNTLKDFDSIEVSSSISSFTNNHDTRFYQVLC